MKVIVYPECPGINDWVPPSLRAQAFKAGVHSLGDLILVVPVVEFQIKHPELAAIERFQRLRSANPSSVDPETGERVSGDGRFHAFLTQGILHDDIATWVDVDMAAFMLEIIEGGIAPYLVERIGEKAPAIASGKLSSVYDRTTQDLFDNLMDILEAGLARDPQIRKDYYSK